MRPVTLRLVILAGDIVLTLALKSGGKAEGSGAEDLQVYSRHNQDG